VPGALIVIEIAAPKVSNDALAVLVSACSRAARDAECVLARNASDAQPAAVAIVSLQSEDKMRVEVGVRQGDHDSWRTKDFAFLAADQSMDRWRAVGFAIGTLAESNPAPEDQTSTRIAPSSASPSPSASPSSASPSPSASPPSASPPSASPPLASPSSASPSSASPPSASPSSASPSPSVEASPEEATRTISQKPGRSSGIQMFVGAAAIFGPGLDMDPPWRLGSTLYADLALTEVPIFFTVGGSAATRLAAGSSSVTTRWFDVSLGAGLPLLGRLDASGLEFRAMVLAEYFDAHASALSRSQTSYRWTVGLQGSFGGRVQIVPDLLLTAEVQAAGLSGETAVQVGGQPVGSSASFRYLGSVGLRVRLR
jgi:hypothetical protein